MSDVPILETERLVLRGHALADFDDLVSLWSDEAVVRHIGGRASTAEECWSRLHRYRGHWALMGHGFWAITEKAGGRYVGDLGLADFRRGIQHPFVDSPEAGWALAPWSHGRGYASEALAAALAWGEGHFGSPRVWCIIDPDNAPSIRVAQRAGFERFGEARYHDDPTVVFVRGA
ncbi:MAG: GNAT family N-acetyltransferase [Proteobacteria bacterium]|nr:GNAT family N-acetyltransferase [Pseudomonadota bacterium]